MARVYDYKMKPGETMFGGGKGVLGLGPANRQKTPPAPDAQTAKSASVPKVKQQPPSTNK